jgi:hypothetical protein
MGPRDTSSRPSGRLVLVLTVAQIPEGMLAKGLLESEGIPVMATGEGEGPYRMGPVYLWVPEEFEIQARMILQEARDSAEEGT